MRGMGRFLHHKHSGPNNGDINPVTLDEQVYTMSPANLVICDGGKPVALAGVMGGLNSEIRVKVKTFHNI